MRQTTRAFILEQCARYPALEAADLLKALHQSVWGNGHFITDEEACLAVLHQELGKQAWVEGAETEPLDGDFFRLHLRMLDQSGLSEKTLLRLFILSAQEKTGNEPLLKEKLEVLKELAEEGLLPCAPEEILGEVKTWESCGFPACHHSERFRQTYRPAYRVLHQKYLPLLPLLATIDQKLAEKERMLLAIDGGSASGKTTLAAQLKEIYGCTVFHMDDFFLRPEQRTPERLAQPGGNVDHERFLAEVLNPLAEGKRACYRRYDCHTQTMQSAVEVIPAPLVVVEGAYSMHPALAERYDLSVLLQVAPKVQRERILHRNGPEIAERFFKEWIPLEQLYFDVLQPAARCDLKLEINQ